MAHCSDTATKFLVISDTHNFTFDENATSDSTLKLPTTKADVLLHCGDMTQVGGVSSFKKALRMMGSIEAELKLVIPGNHDLELDKVFWHAQRDEDGEPENPEDHELAIRAMTGSHAAEAGVTYLYEGTHSFSLRSGATFRIYVSPYTPSFCDWAFAYDHQDDRFNSQDQVTLGRTSVATNPIPDDVDIVMTHGPPYGILDDCAQGNVGCLNLLQATRRVKPMLHCFGHIHEGNGAELIKWMQRDNAIEGRKSLTNPYPEPLDCRRSGGETLAINAAIMTGDYKPTNPPWLVNLNLRGKA